MADDPHPRGPATTYHASRDELLQLLCSTTEDLAAALEEFTVIWETERRAKVQALQQAQAQGLKVTDTDRFVTMATHTYASDTVRAAQEIKALEVTVDHLRFLIPYRPE